MRLGRYEVIEKLGEGGMGEVFLARYEAAAGAVRQVVVKRLLPSVLADEQTLKLFVSEARLTMQLSHGNLVQVFDFGEADGQYFLAMEYVDGLSLKTLLERTMERGLPGVPAPIAVALIIEVTKGLHFAHTRADERGVPLRIIHRDISPENVLISYEGQVKVTDFGVARARLEGRQYTAPGIFRGKPDYAAPEQARAEAQSGQVDVYATGLVLAELISGHNPQEGRLVEVASSGRRLRVSSPLIEASLAEIIDAAIDPDPKTRTPTALALQQALTAWLAANAPIALASGVTSYLAWLEPEQLVQRGLDATVQPAFRDWLSAWTRRQLSDPRRSALLDVPATSPGNQEQATLDESAPTARRPAVTDAQTRLERRRAALWLGGGALTAAIALGVIALTASDPEGQVLTGAPAPTPLPPPPVKAKPAAVIEPDGRPPSDEPAAVTRSVAQYPAELRLMPGAHSVDIEKMSGGLHLRSVLSPALEREALFVRRRTSERGVPRLIAATRTAMGVVTAMVGGDWVPLESIDTTLFVFDQQVRLFWERVDVQVATKVKGVPVLHTTLGNAGPDLMVSVDESQRFALTNLDAVADYEVTLRPADGLGPVFLVEAGGQGRVKRAIRASGNMLARLVPGRSTTVRKPAMLWLTMLTASGVELAPAVIDVQRAGPVPTIIRGAGAGTSVARPTTANDFKRLAMEHGARGDWGQALDAWESCLALLPDPSCRAGAEVARRNLQHR